jgi:hypothetical protein
MDWFGRMFGLAGRLMEREFWWPTMRLIWRTSGRGQSRQGTIWSLRHRESWSSSESGRESEPYMRGTFGIFGRTFV